jgi:hypothetical protein
MLVLPIGLQYRFTRPAWPAIEALLSQLEGEAGLGSLDHAAEPERLYRRLLLLAERILERMERFYREAYHLPLPPPVAAADFNQQITARLAALLDAALRVVEQALAVEPRGDVSARCRRIEQAGWERLFPASGRNGGEALSRLDQGLADRLAEETAQRLWHMRLVESFVAVSGRHVREHPSQERFADTLLILWDTLCRIRGGHPERRPQLGPRRAVVRIGASMDMEPWLEGYRRSRRAAVADLTSELQRQLEGLIVPSRAVAARELNSP